MDMPFFVAFSAILLVGRYLPLNLRPALLADNAARPPARAAKCAISVAVSWLALLVSMQQQGSGAAAAGGRGPAAGVSMMMEARALWFNSAALFLGTLLLGVVAVAPHPPAPFVQQVAVDHLTVVTEIVAINAFAHNLCVFFKIFKV